MAAASENLSQSWMVGVIPMINDEIARQLEQDRLERRERIERQKRQEMQEEQERQEWEVRVGSSC